MKLTFNPLRAIRDSWREVLFCAAFFLLMVAAVILVARHENNGFNIGFSRLVQPANPQAARAK